MNRRSLISRLAVGVAVLGVPSTAWAQGQKVVYIVIKAPAIESIAEIRDKFELAKKSTGGNFNCDGVIVEPIKAETFGLLNAIVTRGADAIREAKEGEEKKIIDRLPGERNAWAIDLGGSALIEGATIDVAGKEEGRQESLEIKVGEAHPRGIDLSFHSAGRYILRNQADAIPLRFRCTATEIVGAGAPKERQVTADFPPSESGLTYLVTLNGVKGDSKFLFDALKDKVPNPLQEMGDVPLIVANFVPNRPTPGVNGWLSLRFPVPPKEDAKRLWLFLAPTKKERDAELARLTKGKDSDEGYYQKIPDRIREKTSTKFLPGADGGWVELSPPKNGCFQTEVQLDVPRWQAAMRAGEADVNDSLLLVYEGEYGEARERRPIKISGGDYVVIEPYPQWLPAIRAGK